MKHATFRWLICGVFLLPAYLAAESMVWNFRIAQVTRQPIGESSNQYDHSVIALLFDQYYRKYDDVRQQFLGILGACMYDNQDYYVRLDSAFSSIHSCGVGSTPYAGTQLDDILVSFGKAMPCNPMILTFSGLVGIPTHRIYSLEHVSFGYNQLGTGMQVDGSYLFRHSNSLLFGWRYIYFFSRYAQDTIGQRYLFTIGNITDVLFAYKHNWCVHGVETGYTLRSRFGGDIKPHLDDTIKKTDYLRSSIYFIYKYHFDLEHSKHRLLFNIAWGRDHSSKIYGNRYIITLWTSWNINF